MTCIVALKQDGKVYMGGDAACVTSSLTSEALGHPKLFEKSGMVFGLAGSPRVMQIVKYHAEFGRYHHGDDPYAYMVGQVVEGIRSALRDHGALYSSEGLEGMAGDSSFLVAFQDEFYEIEANFNVHRSDKDYAATGCGFHLAFGSLYSTPSNMPPADRVRLALSAAAEFSAGVRAPFSIVEFDGTAGACAVQEAAAS